MLTIYHLSTSRSERIVWLMEELGEPYEFVEISRDEKGLSPQAMFDIHPMGKAPVIRDGDKLIIESGAIVEYILARYGNGRMVPDVNSEDYADYLQWMHFAEGSALYTFFVQMFIESLTPKNKKPTGWTRYHDDLANRTLRYIDDCLADKPYFAGQEFTGADIMMMFVFTVLKRLLKRPLADYKNIEAYMTRIESRPAYQKAMQIANPVEVNQTFNP